MKNAPTVTLYGGGVSWYMRKILCGFLRQIAGIKLIILSFFLDQLFVVAPLNDAALIQYHNTVAHFEWWTVGER